MGMFLLNIYDNNAGLYLDIKTGLVYNHFIFNRISSYLKESFLNYFFNIY